MGRACWRVRKICLLYVHLLATTWGFQDCCGNSIWWMICGTWWPFVGCWHYSWARNLIIEKLGRRESLGHLWHCSQKAILEHFGMGRQWQCTSCLGAILRFLTGWQGIKGINVAWVGAHAPAQATYSIQAGYWDALAKYSLWVCSVGTRSSYGNNIR